MRRLTRLTLVAAVLLPLAATAQTNPKAPASAELTQQAKYWEAHGRMDLALESWQKLLRVDPDNIQGLEGAARAQANAGHADAAQVYLDRLRQLGAPAGDIERIDEIIRAGGFDSKKLDAARELVRKGEYDQAVAAYRDVFNNQIPGGRFGLEYYQTLAGATNGWEPARAGLEKLASQNPDDPIYRLALAQHLTYKDETRREGIRRLSALTSDPVVGMQARQAWRQALLWLGSSPADISLYQEYLRRFGNDAQVRKAMDDAQHQVRQSQAAAADPAEQQHALAVRNAYAALDGNELVAAESAFNALLQEDPNDPDALGGLGILRLRQERYEEAEQLLAQASKARPASAGRWSEALASARFWGQVRAADAARKSGQLKQAETLLKQAMASYPKLAASEVAVKVSYADILAEEGRLTDAEAQYRAILKSDPKNVGALQGLMGVLQQSGRNKEALQLAESLPEDVRSQLGGVGSLRAGMLREQASGAVKIGNLGEAEKLLRQALLLDPESPWTRLQLASLYQQQGRIHEANSLIDGLLAGGQIMPDALYIRALLLSRQQQWYQGLETLEQIPAGSRTADMRALQRRLWVRYQTQRAAVLARYGQQQEAVKILDQVEPYTTDSPELLGAMAQGLADAGEDARAIRFMRQALSRSSDRDPGLRLMYAALLFKLKQDAEFEVVMEDLVDEPDLTEQQSLDLANLRIAYRLRQVDQVREQGDLSKAFDYLAPLIRVNPNDPRLQMALARLYNDSSDFKHSLALYQQVLKLDPQNLDACKGAIGALLALNKPDDAQVLIDEALKQDPNNPRLYALAGKAARAQGDDGRALQLFEQALRLDRMQGQGVDAADGAGTRFAPELYLLQPSSGAWGAPVSKADTSLQPRAGTIMDAAWTPHSRAYPRGRLIKVAMSGQQSTAAEALPVLPGEGQVGESSQGGTASTSSSPVPKGHWVRDANGSFRFVPDGAATTSAPDPTLRGDVLQEIQSMQSGRQAQTVTVPVQGLTSAGSNEVMQEIQSIRSQRMPYIGMGVGLRTRDGVDGLDKLTDMELPVEMSIAAQSTGRLTLRIVPVSLDAGTVSGTQLPLFGTMALVDDDTLSYDQSDSGTAVGVVYSNRSFTADVGTSPLGFAVENIVGGINWRPQIGRVSMKLDLSRRSVTDSLLSYAGTYDPGTGTTWGGVTKNGGRADIAYDLGRYGIYGNAGFYMFDGVNVARNQSIELGGGLYARAWESRTSTLTYGVNLTAFAYDKNLRRFTYGHGGYFSPQNYLSVALPIEWVGGNSRIRYRVAGAFGIQSFREDGQSLYPNDSELQDAIETVVADDDDSTLATGYDSKSSTGVGFNLGGTVEYLLAPNIVIGGAASFDNARDYDEVKFGGYVRFLFDPQRSLDVVPGYLQPYYDFGDPTL